MPDAGIRLFPVGCACRRFGDALFCVRTFPDSLVGMANPIFRLLPLALIPLLFSACMSKSTVTPDPVASVDLDRYMGHWYVISHVPYFLERGKVATSDFYARRPDGRLTNNFTFRDQSFDAPEKTWEGVAKIVDPVSNAVWKVSFIWPFAFTYKIFLLDPDYRWAVVGTKDAGLLWVLARERQLPRETYDKILTEMQARSLPIDKLAFVPQPTAP